MKTKLLLTALAICLLTTSVQAARHRHRRNPEVVAQKCIDKVTTLSQAFATKMQTKANRVAAKITNLLTEGNVTSAQRLADRAINSIQSIRHRGLMFVNRICDFCTLELLKWGMGDLAEEVADACAQATDLLMDSGDQAIAAINAALLGSGDDPSE